MVVEKEGNTAVIMAPAHLSGGSVKELITLGNEVLKGAAPALVVDFSRSEMIDSAGIGVLISLTKDFRQKGGRITLRALPDEIAGLFADSGLDKIFDIENASGVQEASIDLFAVSAEIRLAISKSYEGSVCILNMCGVMNHPIGSNFFKQQVLLALAERKKILLDFRDLTFFDSLSVSVILAMNDLLKKTGGSLRVCEANFIIMELFSTLGIDKIIPCFDTVEDAISGWNV